MKPGQEYEVAGTTCPPVKLWSETVAGAADTYRRTFRLRPGQNVLARPVAEPSATELYSVTTRGLKRLTPGGGR